MNLKKRFVEVALNNTESVLHMYDSNLDLSFHDFLMCVDNFRKKLVEESIGSDEVVLIQALNPLHILTSYWGTILNGSIPAMYPIESNIEKHIQAIERLCSQFEITNIVCDAQLFDIMREKNSKTKVIPIDINMETHDVLLESDTEDVSNKTAMLQFSSGSTGTPKGVMLTHKNLISNVDAIINTMQVKKEDIIFNWLPLSHDFGLIVMHMTVLFQGCEQIIMTPIKFLRNPSIWSNIITKYGVSIVAIPNFAMKLILKTYNKQEYENSDLHTLRIVVTAGEGISINTCSKFEQVFCTNKLAKNVIVSAYGLAEATAAVTCGVLEEDATFIVSNNVLIGEKIERNRIQSANDKRIVSCGKIIDCNKVYIYDDEGNQLGDNYVGNIIVEGDNVTKGYYRNPSATKEAIKEGQLNTGDIGFISNGELYISGRKKEMIIINGKNFFSGDVETVINLNLASSKGILIAAFKVTKNDSEELYVAIEGEENFSEQLVREIKKCVLDKMQLKVSNVVVVESIPRTASGKPQYYLLTQMFEKTDVLEVLIEMIEMFTEEKITEDDLGRPFTELGIDSIKMEYMFSELEKKFKVPITIDVIWNYPTLEKLAEYLDKHKTKVSNNKKVNKRISKEKNSYNDQDIAVISMACHFPGNADTPKEYWDNLLQKKDDICDIDEDRMKNLGNNKLKDYKGGYLQDVGALNAKEFGLSPREIQSMDPQQRLLLRTAEELLDNASLNKETVSGTNTGVFVGISNHDYCLLCDDDKGDVYTSTGNAFSIAANRISYLYNLTGPSMSVDTACSSSLVTVHIAAQALKNDECDMAICGGVNVILNSEISKAFYEAQMLSKDSKCKTFDEFANGYVRGEGCGLVLLKRVKDAVADKDDIYAIVKGSAINQDGRSNGLTAPNGNAQKKVITKALEKANISPNELDYIEAHGTGTKLGDPIELNSINSVFENANSNSHICYIGSVKTNIGHLESAAGIASLIKSTLMLNENKIPPILNFKSLNPYIVINEEKIQIATEENLRHRKNILQNIGMSSFGFGGTNCHMIISRYSGNANINKLTSKCKSQDSFWTSVKKRKERNEDIKMNSEVLVEMRKQTELLEKQIILLEEKQFSANLEEKKAEKIDYNIQELVFKALSEVTAYPEASLDINDKLQLDLGIDSIMMAKLIDILGTELSLEQEEVSKVIAAGCEEGTTIKDLCMIMEESLGVSDFKVEESQAEVAVCLEHNPQENIKLEKQVSEFEDYQQIKERMKKEKHNPYYKVSYGMPKNIILTDDGKKINYSTYNYVGLNGDSDIINACVEATKKYGTSVSGSRMISGEIQLHRELENEITSFLGTEDTIVYIGGYTTNVSAISTIVSKEDLILHDSLSHNSIITGCILSGAKRMSFKHNDMNSLESSLKKVRKYYRRILIIVEGIYSMDGDICNLPKLIELKKKYGAILMVDEAHSLGTIGENGRGVGSYYNVDRKDVDLWMGTMSKSLASCGGYISGSKELIMLLKYTSNGFIFSVGISPSNAAAAMEALRKLKTSPKLISKLKDNSEYFLGLMQEGGLDTGLASGTAIIPCILGDSRKCMQVSFKLYEKGINVMPIVYPAVAEKEARLRFFLSTNHTKEEMQYTVDVLKQIVLE